MWLRNGVRISENFSIYIKSFCHSWIEWNDLYLCNGLYIGFQIISCQWLLNMEIHQFHNFYNVESVGGGFFCCCDGGNTLDTCSNESPNVTTTTCDPLCDTFFLVRLLDCEDPDACQVTMTTETIDNSDSITNTSYHFGFFFDTFPNKTVWRPSFMCIVYCVTDYTTIVIKSFSFIQEVYF